MRTSTRRPVSASFLLAGVLAAPVAAQTAVQSVPHAVTNAPVPPAVTMIGTTTSALRDLVERYSADRAALLRRYDAPYSAARRARQLQFYTEWRQRLAELPFDSFDVESRIDYVLLDHELRYELALLDREERMAAEMAPYMPFSDDVIALLESRRNLEPIDPAAIARTLSGIAKAIDATRAAVEADARAGTADNGSQSMRPTRIVASRTAATVASLRQSLQQWYRFYAGYDPLFTWWASEPYTRTDDALEAYANMLRTRIVGIAPGRDEPIIGDPIGAEGLRADLEHQMIAYSPAELVKIAEREFEWCERELRRAARDMGFGDDWKAALERVKTLHVEPGKQTELSRMLAYEAIDFVESRDLVTIPPLAKEIWRMEMLSPEQQKTAPFYLGGEVIRVSFPTDAMEHDDKMMSMRGNNVHFSRAVVHHELIPGHHLQGFMSARYNAHRRTFSTPFWNEGNSLYWEMLLWDLGFPQTPEDRMGMLFWRTHRAARIIFSLSVHLGTMTPDQAIDFLVERVGHERANATAEVRRSLNGTYPPLYQAAYMLGGLQFRALHRELVGSGRMTNREFHDAILQGGTMPVEMVRARLTGRLLDRDHTADWKFGEVR